MLFWGLLLTYVPFCFHQSVFRDQSTQYDLECLFFYKFFIPWHSTVIRLQGYFCTYLFRGSRGYHAAGKQAQHPLHASALPTAAHIWNRCLTFSSMKTRTLDGKAGESKGEEGVGGHHCKVEPGLKHKLGSLLEFNSITRHSEIKHLKLHCLWTRLVWEAVTL